METEKGEMNVAQFLENCLGKNIAFYAFSRPESRQLEFGAELKNHPQSYTDIGSLIYRKGFVFAPFRTDQDFKAYFIESEITGFSKDSEQKIQKCDTIEPVNDSDVYETSRDEYQLQIVSMVNELQAKHLDKAILSRISVLQGKGRKDAVSVFLRLNDTYPDAFVFMVNIPMSGLWIGATPERLIRVSDNGLETMALAGTQRIGSTPIERIIWETKEKEEQAYVSRYIEDLLGKYEVKKYLKEGPINAKAGNLVHLKTLFRVQNDWNDQQLGAFIQDLHPTPAVCGLPKAKALELIQRIENHQREYYAGYLGPIDGNRNLSLFVNLRSMKVLQNRMALFVGGGITAASDPDKEWDETCFKAQTLLNVIK